MNGLPGYDDWKLMSPEEDDIPEVPYNMMVDKIREWADNPPVWLCEKAIMACEEDNEREKRRKGWAKMGRMQS